MAQFTQEDRIARLSTPLGPDILLLAGFNVTEGLSDLFRISIEATSTERDIDFDRAIGQACEIALDTRDGKKRVFNGILTEAISTGGGLDLYSYDLVLRPWFWLLAHRADCRIFLDKTVKEIIEDVFQKAGFASGLDYEFKTQESYDPIPYCVQYRETDLVFVSRLMEEFGIYYYFKHETGRHTMTLADGVGSHDANRDVPSLTFRTADISTSEQHFTDWMRQRRYGTGKYEVNDYDFKQPGKSLIASKTTSEGYTRSKFEVYDYPGRHLDTGRGGQIAQHRLEAEQAFDRRHHANGYAPSLFPGTIVNVTETRAPQDAGSYLIVSCHHSYKDQQYRTGGASSAFMYDGHYEMQKRERPFRAFPSTPKPRIHGVQTAKVVPKKGDEGEEISTDEHGRIWVQFHWDREKSISCPVRVAQAWSGKKWGEVFIPRVGMEVVVEFLEGDPDQPLVVGCVYNGNNQPPWELPKNKTIAGWKSESSKGGQGYNQIYLEDKKSEEEINVHAQKDLNVTILNNETRSVGNDMATTIGNSETRTIGKEFKTPTGKSSYKTTVEKGDVEMSVLSGAILYDAKVKIVLKVGPSSITIDPTGITLDAPTITIKAATTCIIQGLPVKIN